MRLATLAASALLAACATSAPRLDASLASWTGASLDDLVETFGYPVREVRLSRTTAYTFGGEAPVTTVGSERTTTETRSTILGPQTTTTSLGVAPQTFMLSCWRTFEMDEGGRVVKASWSGNNCAARSRP